jgi:hypothetical protein
MARRTLSHAGRVVWIELMETSNDVSCPTFSQDVSAKTMIVVRADTPTGSFSIPLPIQKARDLADLLKCAIDEILVKKIMQE